MQPAGTTHSPVKAALNCIHNFAKFPPPKPMQNKKSCMDNPSEDSYSFAAELRPVSNSLVVNMEFRMTLMGQRMAPQFERERRE